ncbi:MAG: hypothetical protein ACK4NF_04410 [Planctomycetota bacterium]
MENKKIERVVLYLLLVVAITGCARIKKWKEDIKTKIDIAFQPPKRAVSTALPLEEFPPPFDFYLLKNESWAYKDGNNLYSRILYQGKGKINLVTNFYTNVLHNKGWTIVEQKSIENYTYLKFDNSNNNHTAEFVIKSIPSGTLITISIKPM